MQRIVVIISLLFLTACATTTGYHPETNYSGVKFHESRVKDVYLFYPGTRIPGEFEQLGIVTATGDKGASDNDVISHLKMKALNSGADAIIEVDRRIAPRDSGFIFEDEQDSYHAISYQGTAIRFTDLEALPDHVKGHMSVPDYDSEQLVRSDQNNQSNSIMFELLLSLAIGIAYIISL